MASLVTFNSNTVLAIITAAGLLVAGSVWFGRLDDEVTTTLQHVDKLDAEIRNMERTLDRLAKEHEPGR